MKRFAIGLAVASLALFTTACGGADDEPDETAAAPAASAQPETEPEESEEGSEPAATEPADGAEPTVLLGTVGTPDDPEAFEIALTDEDGEPVTTLPAGDYIIEVSDPATSHNFHLTGESVDETTSVPETVETTFEVTFEPGEYEYTCDPHPAMTGSFTVT